RLYPARHDAAHHFLHEDLLREPGVHATKLEVRPTEDEVADEVGFGQRNRGVRGQLYPGRQQGSGELYEDGHVSAGPDSGLPDPVAGGDVERRVEVPRSEELDATADDVERPCDAADLQCVGA